MKHLKLRARLVPNSKEAIVTVVEQTHGYYEFGNSAGKSHFRCSEGAISSHPMTVPLMGSNLWLGTGPGIEFIIQQSRWPKIKKLVEAYNEWGATQP